MLGVMWGAVRTWTQELPLGREEQFQGRPGKWSKRGDGNGKILRWEEEEH